MATSSRSDGNNSEMVPAARAVMPADLFHAATKGNSDHLIRHLGLSAEEKNHTTVTIEACETDTQETAENKEVIQYKLRSVTAFGDTVLHILIANGHNNLALKVFQKDASLLKAQNKKLETPLHRAAKVGNADIFRKFIQLAPTQIRDALEETNIDGDTALHLASKHGHNEVGIELLQFNRELVYKVNKEGSSPLHLALIENQHSMFELILSVDSSLASAQFSNGMFPVHVAASMRNTSLILTLLQKYPDYANLKDQNGRNFFHTAAEENINEVFTKELTNKGKKMLNEKDHDGNTPLHIAARKGNSFIMKAIWGSLSSPYVQQKNNKGQTPFDISEVQLRNTAEDFQYKFKKHVKNRGRNFSPEWFDWLMKADVKNRWERAQVIGLGSVLITTISFAAGFTFPGGYDVNTGGPILGRKSMFQVFILTNAFAFILSFLSVFVLVTCDNPVEDDLRLGLRLFLSAASCMMKAFGSGSYVMLVPVSKPIAIFILSFAVVAASFLEFIYWTPWGRDLLAYFGLIRYRPKYKPL